MKKQKGITLIALVITIIVLLILAGVTIATLTGDNGILGKVNEAKTKSDIVEVKEQEKVYTLEQEVPFTIEKEKGTFIVKGEKVDSIMRRVNIGDYESLFYLHKKLDEIGLNKALKKQGIREGDIVKIGDYEMEWED